MNDETGLVSGDNRSIQSIAHRTPSLRIDGMIYEGDIPDAQWHKLNLTAAETLAPGTLQRQGRSLTEWFSWQMNRLGHNMLIIGTMHDDHVTRIGGSVLTLTPIYLESARLLVDYVIQKREEDKHFNELLSQSEVVRREYELWKKEQRKSRRKLLRKHNG